MNKINLSVFASGTGSNLLAIHKATMDINFPGKLKLVICNKICPAFELAKSLNYETKLITSLNIKKFETIVQRELIEKKVDLICLAGFMRILSPKFVSKWENKILNIHPSILPLFTGLNTHKKALSSGIKIHGSTVHIVNEKLDSGKILGQFAFAVKRNDLNFLIDNIKKYENILYPEVIKKYIWTFLLKKDNFLDYKKIQIDNVVFSY
ncbi:phosphoribosylglycinamide formyltransferase [Alphaproteobacteria bacterium]|nr:phosphoribosylglycinamide formyltransferase [Alphaproteobacteria bacterium]